MAERLLSVLFGYGFGCFLTAEVVARLRTGKSALALGNPGTARIGAELGAKAGAAVLCGDLLKAALAAALCRWILFPGLGSAAALYAGLGCVLGHDFPFWSRFRGGKGVAVTCMAAVLFSPSVGLLSVLAGLLAVLLTRYLAAGAAAVAVAFPLLTALLGFGAEAAAVAAAMGAVMLLRFAPSLRRILRGEEKRIALPYRRKTPPS